MSPGPPNPKNHLIQNECPAFHDLDSNPIIQSPARLERLSAGVKQNKTEKYREGPSLSKATKT